MNCIFFTWMHHHSLYSEEGRGRLRGRGGLSGSGGGGGGGGGGKWLRALQYLVTSK